MMADILDVTVIIKRNGREIAGFPYQKRMVVDEIQSFAYEKATGGGYETLPTTQIATLQALVLTVEPELLSRVALVVEEASAVISKANNKPPALRRDSQHRRRPRGISLGACGVFKRALHHRIQHHYPSRFIHVSCDRTQRHQRESRIGKGVVS